MQVSVCDKLPVKMCLNCISEMNQAFAFKQKCERSEETLRQYLQQMHIIPLQSIEQMVGAAESISIEEVEELEEDEVTYDNDDDEAMESEIVCPHKSEDSEATELEIHSEIYHCANDAKELQTNSEISRHPCSSTIEYITCVTIEDQTSLQSKKTPAEHLVKDFIAENTLNFICSRCKASFSGKRSLNLHFNSGKCLEQSFECCVCHKIFIKKRYLLRHLQRMHEIQNKTVESADESKQKNVRKYKCDLCPKGKSDCQ